LKRKEQEKKDETEDLRDQIVSFFFSTHPPSAQRIAALDWEANFVKMPPRKAHYASATFAEMKRRATQYSER
jgi:hypothetical protein